MSDDLRQVVLAGSLILFNKKYIMRIDPEYKIGDVVYLLTDPEQNARMVIGYIIRQDYSLVYILGCGVLETDHHSIEMSDTKSVTF